MQVTRRAALQSLLATTATAALAKPAAARFAAKQSLMGLCQYCVRIEQRLKKKQTGKDHFTAEKFLDHAAAVGAGGIQLSLGVMDQARAEALRQKADTLGLYIEGIVGRPKKPSDVEHFDAQMKTAAAVGAPAVRSTIFTGRRYEYFESLEQYREHDKQARRTLELVAPVAEKHKVAFAPENHKDHRIAERVAALERIDSPYVGACVDTGNNFALLEDPVMTARELAPWAHAVHIKDQALQLTKDGFLFGDIPLGQGFIDLKQIVTILRNAKPKIHFTLELLTRDPLHVPCLEEKYWRTFPDLPAEDLARTLRTVRDNQAESLQYPSKMDPQQQVELEQSNVRQSLDYAIAALGL